MTDATSHYAPIFKTWQTKFLGPKPTAEQLDAIHGLKARPGKQALAIAMGLRDCGVTNSQIVIACGAPQLNKMRGFISDALLKRLPAAKSPEGHEVYKLEVTPKGLKRIEATKAQAAKLEAEGKNVPARAPAKAKGKAKAKKAAKAKPVETPVSEPAKVNVVPQGEPLINDNDVHAA